MTTTTPHTTLNQSKHIAIWALTATGAQLAARLAEALPGATLFVSRRVSPNVGTPATPFDRLRDTLAAEFQHFDGHVFIMATGIVVRLMAPLIAHKTTDPAVVVMDDAGRFAISLLAGHIGGANRLAEKVAAPVNATPVITTATDTHDLPAIDTLAVAANLAIENPAVIKTVNMAILETDPVLVHDPFDLITAHLPPGVTKPFAITPTARIPNDRPGVFVDDIQVDLPPNFLVLRPSSLVAGIGCNRNTPQQEIEVFLRQVLAEQKLALRSLAAIVTVDLKKDETGLLATADALGVPLHFYSRRQLDQAPDVPNPSAMVAKHIGVKSVCEAAALLAAQPGRLIVPKHNTRNVTVAIARRAFTSSASDRATGPT